MDLTQLKQLQKKAITGIIISFSLVAIIAVICFFITQLLPILIFGLMFAFFLSFLVSAKPRREFKRLFKKVFVEKSLQGVFTDLDYRPESGLSRYTIASTQMMDMGDRYSSNDFISAKYKDINVMQADVHIEEKRVTTDSKGRTQTTWVTLFLGRWMVFDFNKSFNGDIQVCQKGFGNSVLNNWKREERFKKVQLEDQDFNKKFRVYAQSEHDAFYVLTPSLMQKIKDLTASIKGRLLFCFIDKDLHVGIQNNKDSFECGIFTKLDEEKILQQISCDIKLITNFVDQLNLDNDLFKKEN